VLNLADKESKGKRRHEDAGEVLEKYAKQRHGAHGKNQFSSQKKVLKRFKKK
jgi:hypothetical protein